MRKVLVLVFGVFLTLPVFSQTAVAVGGSPAQAPFTIGGGGLSQDLLTALNGLQTQYKFTLSDMPAARVRDAVNSGELPLIIFSNVDWGYDKTLVERGPDLVQTGDRYVAAKAAAKDQSVFDGVGTVSMVGVLGFNYQYAGFTADQKVLKEKYHTVLTTDEASVIKMVLAGRAQIGVVSATLLEYTAKTDPATYGQLLVSKGFDSEYVRTFVVSKKSPVSAKDLAVLMKKLADSGKLAAIYAKYGMAAPKS